ncbi:MAG: SpoIIE family protein phosphatase [Armatimonadota bacterium]
MDKGYIHVEIETAQTSKKAGAPCGDVVAYERTETSTTLVCSDGIGSGIKANIAAEMCVSRLLQLLRQGNSLRKAFTSMAATMDKAKGTDMPYAVFTVVRILNDGVATVLSYEMPPPIFVTSRYANVLPQRTVTMDTSLIGEANCHVEPGEGILVVSDGITQAGLGAGLANGWGPEGVSQFISDRLRERINLSSIPKFVVQEARQVWGNVQGDDCTAALASCRWGKTVHILTGPPSNPIKDRPTVKQFLMLDGVKVVCGGTTSKIVADYLGTEVRVESNPRSTLAPAKYEVDGVDLVTEGAVTLNQMYNVFDEDPDNFDEESGVTELQELLRTADRVHFMIGRAENPANKDISFRQRGILTRQAIIPLICKKLQEAGKLVVIEFI